MVQYVLAALQTVSCLTGIFTAYAAYRLRDNERAAALTEIRTGLKALERQMENLERRLEETRERLEKHRDEEWEKKRGIA